MPTRPRARKPAPSRARQTELQCEALIIKTAREWGWLVHGEATVNARFDREDRHVTAIKGDPGWPDLVLAHPLARRLIVVELKRPPNVKPSENQQRWINTLRACGVDVRVVLVPDQQDALIHELITKRRPADMG